MNDELPVRTPPPTRRRWWLAVGLLGAAAITGLAAWRLEPSRNRSYTDRPITIQTVHGDIAGPGADVDTSGVRVGLPVGPGEDVSALLEFSPDEEAEQAGVLIWQDQDNYIQLGRRFMGRNQVVFLMEEAGHSSGEPENLRYDSDGQNGQPLWLAIRRSGNTYLAFTSTDGENWRQEGRSLTPQTPFRQPRAAIYAFYGRREAKPEPAVFSHLSVGRTFFGWQNGSAEDELLQQGWSRRCSCGSGCGLQPEPLGLSLSLPGGPDACQVEWTRPLGQTDWTLTTRLDYFPMPGVSAGIGVRGPKGAVRLVRYFLNEPSISLIYDGKMLIGEPDRNGSPAVYLRLAAQGGVIRAAFSQDGQHYRRLPAEIPLAELGSGLNAGLRMNASGSSRESFPARFDFFRQSIDHLTLYR